MDNSDIELSSLKTSHDSESSNKRANKLSEIHQLVEDCFKIDKDDSRKNLPLDLLEIEVNKIETFGISTDQIKEEVIPILQDSIMAGKMNPRYENDITTLRDFLRIIKIFHIDQESLFSDAHTANELKKKIKVIVKPIENHPIFDDSDFLIRYLNDDNEFVPISPPDNEGQIQPKDIQPELDEITDMCSTLQQIGVEPAPLVETIINTTLRDDFENAVVHPELDTEQYLTQVVAKRLQFAHSLGIEVKKPDLRIPKVGIYQDRYSDFINRHHISIRGYSSSSPSEPKLYTKGINRLIDRAMFIKQHDIDPSFATIENYMYENQQTRWFNPQEFGFDYIFENALDEHAFNAQASNKVLARILKKGKDYRMDTEEQSKNIQQRAMGVIDGYISNNESSSFVYYTDRFGGIESHIYPEGFFKREDVKQFARDGIVSELTSYNVLFDHANKLLERFGISKEEFEQLAIRSVALRIMGHGVQIAWEKVIKEYALPQLDSAHDKLPLALQDIMHIWNVKSYQELTNVVDNNREFFKYIGKDVDTSIGLTSGDLDVYPALHISLLEASKLRKAGVNLHEFINTENYQQLFKQLITHDEYWKENPDLRDLFEKSAKVFGYKNIFTYLDSFYIDSETGKPTDSYRQERYNHLRDFQKIIGWQQASGLSPEQFYENILGQIATDTEISSGLNAHYLFTNIVNKLDTDIMLPVEGAQHYSEVDSLQEQVKSFETPQQIFSSWKSLQLYVKYVNYYRIVNRVDMNIDVYPKNSTLHQLIELHDKPQVGPKLLKSLENLPILEYEKHVKPLIAAQGVAAFLFFDSMKTIPNFDQLSLGDVEYITFIGKKYGTRARNILDNLLTHVSSISDEREMIESFIKDIEIINFDLYEEYKQLVNTNNIEGLDKLKESLKTIQNAIYKGEVADDHIDSPFYDAVVYHTFPPAIGITQDQYARLNEDRLDRRADVPSELNDLQYDNFAVQTGTYALGEGQELELDHWEEFSQVVRRVNKELRESGKTEIDEISIAQRLIEIFRNGKSLTSEDRNYLFESMYKYHLAHDGGELKEGYEMTLPGLMIYKEFIGERIKNNLIRDCLEKHQEVHGDEFEQLKHDVLSRINKQQQGNIGIVKNMLRGIKRQQDDARRESSIARLDDFLRDYGLSYERIKGQSFEEYRQHLVIEDDTDPNELVYRKISSDLVLGINKEMRKEVEKYDFDPQEEGKAVMQQLQFVISKKREHGVVGYNMGVCVAPDEELWDDTDFWEGIIFDPVIKQAMGGVHFLIRDGCLTLPGINPSLAILSQVNNEDLYDRIIDYSRRVKEKLGLQKVLIPSDSAIHSNRTQIQEIIRNRNYPIYSFDEVQTFSHSPYEYSFQETFEVC